MLKRTIGELQVELFNHLRMKQLYGRLINVVLEPSNAFSCGWRADVVGDFTVTEHHEANEIVRDLNADFRFDPIPLRIAKVAPAPSDIAWPSRGSVLTGLPPPYLPEALRFSFHSFAENPSLPAALSGQGEPLVTRQSSSHPQ